MDDEPTAVPEAQAIEQLKRTFLDILRIYPDGLEMIAFAFQVARLVDEQERRDQGAPAQRVH